MLIIIIIIIVVIILLKELKDYYDAKPGMQAYHRELVEEGKQLKKEAEEEMSKEKCLEDGNCDFVLEKTVVEPLYGWDDEITEYYKCTRCGKEKNFIVQYPN